MKRREVKRREVKRREVKRREVKRREVKRREVKRREVKRREVKLLHLFMRIIQTPADKEKIIYTDGFITYGSLASLD